MYLLCYTTVLENADEVHFPKSVCKAAYFMQLFCVLMIGISPMSQYIYTLYSMKNMIM